MHKTDTLAELFFRGRKFGGEYGAGLGLTGMQLSYYIHSGNVSSSSVNGDIAFLWEWSNFDHS